MRFVYDCFLYNFNLTSNAKRLKTKFADFHKMHKRVVVVAVVVVVVVVVVAAVLLL